MRCLPLLLLMMIATLAFADPQADLEAGKKVTRAELEAIETKLLEDHYANRYSEPIAQGERMPGLISVVSLSRIDAGRTTEALVKALDHRETIVGYVAWEALHARHTKLTAEQREAWLKAGVRIAAAGGFPGATARPLLRAARELPAEAYEAMDLKRFFDLLIEQNNPGTEPGKQTLAIAAKTLAAWRDRTLAQRLAEGVSHNATGAAARLVLSELPNAPTDSTERGDWLRWAREADFTPPPKDQMPKYDGSSSPFPQPEKITDPFDGRWRQELEVSKLAVSNFDLVWVIDSTGSMAQANLRVAAETGTVMKALSLLSRKARCGTIYVRHEVVSDVMQACCKKAPQTPGAYQVKPYTLTDKVDQLGLLMHKEPIPKPGAAPGNTHPGTAVHGGLHTAITRMPWSSGDNSRRVIVLVGDATPTPDSVDAARKLAAEAKKLGYQIHALVIGKAVTTWPPILEAAGGEMIPFNPNSDANPTAKPAQPKPKNDKKPPAGKEGPAGKNQRELSPFEQVAATVMMGAVPKGFQAQIETLAPIILDYARELP